MEVNKNIKSKSLCIFDLDNENLIFGYNENRKLPIASLAKIMTIYLVLLSNKDLDEKISIPRDVFYDKRRKNAASLGIRSIEKISRRDLIYATMLASCCDTATTLALDNSTDFINRMNMMAIDCQLSNTVFSNPDGLDDISVNTSTASDICMLLVNALSYSDFYDVFTTNYYHIDKSLLHPWGIDIKSTISKKDLGCIDKYDKVEILGGKTGTSYNAGLCLATLLKVDGVRYIVVSLGADFDDIDNLCNSDIMDLKFAIDYIKSR